MTFLLVFFRGFLGWFAVGLGVTLLGKTYLP